MIRGCERRIYHVKNPESEIFDEAYFILRRGSEPAETPARRRALDDEVRRIVSGTGAPDRGRCPARRDRLVSFAAGAVVSAVVVMIAFFLFR